MEDYVIECHELSKQYGTTIAVDNLNLSVKRGEIFGLLGPNGAGKTTTILMMMGLTEPTKGEVHVCGYNATREAIKVKRRVGYLQDNVGFYDDITAAENLELVAKLNKMETTRSKIDQVLNRVGLLKVRDHKVGTFSRGMRQRLGIADLLIKDAEVVILDEPTLGLDPEGIDSMLSLILELAAKDKRTVVISSHLLYQIQKICTRVGIFFKGKLVVEGAIDELAKEKMGDNEGLPDLETIYKRYFEEWEVNEHEKQLKGAH